MPKKNYYKDSAKPVRRSDEKCNEPMSFMTKLFMGRIEKHSKSMHEAYLNDNEKWLRQYGEIKDKNNEAAESYNQDYKNHMKSLEDIIKSRLKKLKNYHRGKRTN